ncbi:propionate CoA-transferase [Staphylococcus saprophyticus]|uniref:fatty acid degradation protein FadX n=1 Tax=Staphylococcus saprophyticus TaxID=29385 RepID=UPI000859D9C7|nr:CoA-transferase [Staphylococcus saprophyticus]MBN6851163.1 acyl CoA:acetate/3-ketoacid CoA transferase [Staphylococcus saprophyticus]MDW3892866.1 CoA-transferase [Staphylococcus saprophyticus]MDW3919854.1 CoA-transferase [Staphylococcus saprophyticus]MDW3932503.1 CoA-transferase [Staphylococcus saprophyticus]MDW3957891.1 CoA-transferase [Staphylococcus saprophyticus]
MKIIPFSKLTSIINKGDVIALAALSTANLPAEILKTLVEYNDEDQSFTDFTFMLANDISDYRGDSYDLDAFTTRGMIKRLITSIITASPATINAMRNNEIEAYYLPQGVITTHYRSKTQASPGTISKIGLNTNVDPRYTGGKVNERTTEDLVSLIEINQQTYLQYDFPDIDIALLRGTYADMDGNIYMTHEAHLGEGYSLALATHNNRGKVIVQVKAVIQNGNFNPNDVFIPGKLVDYVVVNTNPKLHRQVMQTQYDPALSGHYQITEMREPYIALGTRKVILRRAAQFLLEGDVISIGFGINNELSNVLSEEQVNHLVQPNIDTGVFGGLISSREHFGMNYNLSARMRHDMTWDFIYNNGLDVAYLSFAEVDQRGNVNVSKFGEKMNGCGGFIDISQTVKTIVFSGVMVVGGQLSYENNKVTVEAQGRATKFVDKVGSMDFNAENAIKFNQEVYFVTERAVFELTHKGLKLIEIAPGLDLEQDILANMAFRPILSDDIKLTQSDIYQAHWGGLAQAIKSDYRI